MDLAQEALGGLRDYGFHGVGHIFRAQHLRGVLCPARREFRSYASRADHTDADAVFAKVFRHTAGKPDNTPFGRAIDSSASKGIFS